MWIVKFTVEGGGYFPIDMLRYDGCYPNSSEDASNISFDAGGKRKVKLVSCNTNRKWTPTNERWQSFGWRVTNVESSYKI